MPANPLLNLQVDALLHHIDVPGGVMTGSATSVRHLSDLRGCFSDTAAFERRLDESDDVIYWVAAAGTAKTEGALDFAVGTLLPGRIGDEYYLTKGHYHAWRDAAEVYLGMRGEGGLILETDDGQERFVPFAADELIYVPGATAHRTVNTGAEPLTYLGIYPARAGHDYASIASDNFRLVIVAGPDGPQAIRRTEYLQRHTQTSSKKERL